MKSLAILIMAGAVFGALTTVAGQVVNWRTLRPDQNHIASMYAGIEYGAV